MTNRRKFLKLSALGAGAVALGKCGNAVEEHDKQESLDMEPSYEGPIAVSTWNHGMAANAGAWEVLGDGGSALDAVEKGVAVTEADLSNRSVGLGGLPDRDGFVTLDACIMDERNRAGAVAFLQNIDHPIKVARRVMEDTAHVMLVGKGAYQFALNQGFEPTSVKNPVPEALEWLENWRKENNDQPEVNIENHDTIGMVALDSNGNMSGACTTSGLAGKIHGRVGDSPIIGAGLFVDNEVGAATATGVGEMVIRIAGSHTVVELMRAGATPQQACKQAVERIIAKHDTVVGSQVGFLAIDKYGRHGAYSIYSGFNYALRTVDTNEMVDANYMMEW